MNIDVAAGRFQKEGFPELPIEHMAARRMVLMHQTLTNFTVTASLDRNLAFYLAQSEDLKTHAKTATRYACTTGPVFEVADVR